MKSAFASGLAAFAATLMLLQAGLLPGAWSAGRPPVDGFEQRHMSEDASAVAAELGLEA